MSTENQEAQADELLALTSIYSEDEFLQTNEAPGGEIILCLDLPSDFVVSIKCNGATNSFADNFENTVSFLPPVVLRFDFPPGYPSTTPPNFKLSCKWLSPTQLTQLCQHLDHLWEENKGCVVLFPWIQFLKEETLDYLNIKSPYEVDVSSNDLHNQMQSPDTTCADGVLSESGSSDKRAIQDVESVPALIKYIVDFNEAQQKKAFDSKPFSCHICFMEKLGSECTHFNACQHVYCNNCLKDYFEIQIQEGQVRALNCPEPKCTSVATPAQVKDLVGEQLFSRYDRLLLQSSLDVMADVVYCPRLSCQAPVMKEPDDTMGICSVCQYAFCVRCQMTFHGIAPCKEPEEINEEDMEPPEGESNELVKLVEKIKNKLWIKENSKPCPRCNSPIEKNEGCDHMTCARCNEFFCWRCLKNLSRRNLHKHYCGTPESLNEQEKLRDQKNSGHSHKALTEELKLMERLTSEYIDTLHTPESDVTPDL